MIYDVIGLSLALNNEREEAKKKEMKETKLIFNLLLCLIISVSANAQGMKKDTLPQNFYKYFVGTIAGQPVQVLLESKDGSIDGSYEYVKQGKSIYLSLLPNQSKGWQYTLGEYTGRNYNEDNPQWKCVFKNDSLTGVWIDKNNGEQYVLRLKAVKPKDSLFWIQQHFKDKDAPKIGGHKAGYDIKLSYPIVIGHQYKVLWLNRQIKDIIHFDTTHSYRIGQINWVTQFIEGVKEAVEKIGSDRTWTSHKEVTLSSEIHGYVSLRIELYQFSGGIHGIAGNRYEVYDLHRQKKLKWTDITSMKTDQLQELIEKRFRQTHHLSPSTPIDSLLKFNSLPPSANFSIDEKGITFHYNFYPSPTINFLSVTVPYKQLKGTMNPEFRKRMNITSGEDNQFRVYKRRQGEAPKEFAKRIKPDSMQLIPHQVFETNHFGTGDILAFYKKVVTRAIQMDTYVDHTTNTYIYGYLYLPISKNEYQRILIGKIYPDGGLPMLHSVFYVNADDNPEDKELVVIVKIPQRHYDYGGAFYETYFYHFNAANQSFSSIYFKNEDFMGCECSFRNGKTTHAKYKTASVVKKKLKAMGY